MSINLLVLLILGLLSGCASINPRQTADHIANTAGLNKQLIKTKTFTFTSYAKFKNKEEALTVYIEGDGRSYLSRHEISPDPTPHNPIALKLASLDSSSNVAYLARPCQYTPHNEDPYCNPKIWTRLRFSENVVNSVNQAIEHLKQDSKAKKIHLVGFSGGAAIAVLIAARRNDIASIKTIAGDLDHKRLSQFHKTGPLQDALDPKEVAPQLHKIPQHHFCGGKDTIVPPFISEGFVNEILRIHPENTCIQRTVFNNFTHHKGWEEIWPELALTPALSRGERE